MDGNSLWSWIKLGQLLAKLLPGEMEARYGHIIARNEAQQERERAMKAAMKAEDSSRSS